tara:strand:- start:1301 stop:1963 length:663 start_codon:yes stop_codon:yes gene_type:complete
MIYLFLVILFLTGILTLLIFQKSRNKKNKTVYVLYFLSTFITVLIIYLYVSNYWIGEDIGNKIVNNLNIKDANKINPETIATLVNKIEEKLKDDPYQIELIKKLAQLKYFSLDIDGALNVFEMGRKIDSSDIDFLLGEANTRLILEKENLSQKTIDLFNEILIRKPDDITALLVIADYNFYLKDYNLSKSYYEKLLSLIDENSLEYKSIKKNLDEIKKNK